jgi:hypothetical protein
MAKASPQTFQKRQRERRKQEKREQKFERRLIRSEEKRIDKAENDDPVEFNAEVDEDGNVVEIPASPPQRIGRVLDENDSVSE